MITDFDLLVTETARVFNISADEVLSSSRKKEPTRARHVVMALWADDHSFQDTANRCGRKCHSTVIHAREKLLNRAGIDESLASIVETISKRCQYDANPSAIEELEEKSKFIEFYS